MAKKNCEICNAEIGLIKQIKLADGNFICRDCLKKAISYFNHMEKTLYDYKDHMKQLDDGKKLYEAYFAKNKKVEKTGNGHILIDPQTALICFTEMKGQILFWGGTRYSMVFRLADIDRYEDEVIYEKGSDGKNVEKHAVHFFFRNTPGLYDFKMKTDGGWARVIENEINKALGLKGLKGIKTGWKKGMEDIKTATAVAGNIKNIIANKDGGEEAIAEDAKQAIDSINDSFYNGRQELCEKADAAIKNVLG